LIEEPGEDPGAVYVHHLSLFVSTTIARNLSTPTSAQKGAWPRWDRVDPSAHRRRGDGGRRGWG
jgi:hypothetical protein